MAVREPMLILMCLFCCALAQSDDHAMDIHDLLSKVYGGQEITIDDLLPQLMTDDAVEFLGSLDDDIGEVVNLELANTELVKACSHGECKYCTKKFHFEFCIKVKLTTAGFDLTVTVNSRVIFHKEISVEKPLKVCLRVPLLGKVCVYIEKINLKDGSACVGVIVKIGFGPFKKTIKLQIKCFKIGKHEEL